MCVKLRLVVLFCLGLVLTSSHATQLTRPFVGLYSTTNEAQQELSWSTQPGVRYVLQESSNLTSNGWTTVAGYPSKAEALAQQYRIGMNSSQRFYRVLALDEQPPELLARTPEADAFGVPRFSTLHIELDDTTGIDTNSVALTLGALGPYTLNSTEVSWSNNVLKLDLGGDYALGGYGATVDVSVAVADWAGFSTNYSWQFELEKEIVESDNLFVFGSPDARRAGQQLSGEAAVLAARHATGPIRMNSTVSAWEIARVETNRIVVSYSSTVPSFELGQPLANLAPGHVNQIFYRQVDALVTNQANRELTLFTSDITLADIMIEGSFSIGEDAVFLDFDENGYLIKSVSGDATFELPTLGVDYSDQIFFSDGPLTFTMEEAKFLFHPRLKVSVEVGFLSGLQRMEAEASGDIEIACIPYVELTRSWSGDYSKELWSKTRYVKTGYVFVELTASVRAEASIAADATATLRTGFRQNANIGVSGIYTKGASSPVTWDRWFNPDPFEKIPFRTTLDGFGEATVSLIPQIDARVVSLAGLYVNIDPRLETEGSASMENGKVIKADWMMGAYADINAGLSVIGTPTGSLPSLPPFRFFSKEWEYHYEKEPDPMPPTIKVQPKSQTAKLKDPISFSVEATADSSLTYQWYHNGNRLPGETRNVLSFRRVTEAHEGQYGVRVSADGLFIYSSEATLKVVEENGTGPEVSGYVLLNSPQISIWGMGFGHDGVVYDTVYPEPPHCKIVTAGGYLAFAFDGKKSFYFHSLGSTYMGDSYCYVDIYINGVRRVSKLFIDSLWTTYRIPESAFGEGENQVAIVLTPSTEGMSTHFWIDKVYAR